MQWYIATEDALSQAVAKKLLIDCLSDVEIISDIGQTGNGKLRDDMRSRKYFQLSQRYPILVLTDLDRHPCAPGLLKQWCPDFDFPSNLFFRVVVRETEAWLMADQDAFSRFSGISIKKLPRRGNGARVSPSYNNILIGFVERFWNPAKGSVCSRSLRKALERLSQAG